METDVERRPENRVLIFDTTLRDGEQSPGASLNSAEKLEIAHHLAQLAWISSRRLPSCLAR